MTHVVLAEIIGPDLLIVVGVIVLIFGGAKIPQLARSLGSAQSEFKKGLADGAKQEIAAPQPETADPT